MTIDSAVTGNDPLVERMLKEKAGNFYVKPDDTPLQIIIRFSNVIIRFANAVARAKDEEFKAFLKSHMDLSEPINWNHEFRNMIIGSLIDELEAQDAHKKE